MRTVGIAVAPEAPLHGPWGRTVFLRAPVLPTTASVRRLVDGLAPGECIAFAIPLNGPVFQRLRTITTFRLRRRRILHAMRDAGALHVRRFGVDPDLEMPSCIYELDTAAALYADRCLRPSGRLRAIRRVIERVAGCDPALGAVVIVGRKPE
jgi:hypothetical protein